MRCYNPTVNEPETIAEAKPSYRGFATVRFGVPAKLERS